MAKPNPLKIARRAADDERDATVAQYLGAAGSSIDATDPALVDQAALAQLYKIAAKILLLDRSGFITSVCGPSLVADLKAAVLSGNPLFPEPLSRKRGIKSLTIRWPEDFWEAVSIEATKRRTSVQALVTDAISEKLGITIPTDLDSKDSAA